MPTQCHVQLSLLHESVRILESFSTLPRRRGERQRYVARFTGESTGHVLTPENIQSLVQAFGTDTLEWIGKDVSVSVHVMEHRDGFEMGRVLQIAGCRYQERTG